MSLPHNLKKLSEGVESALSLKQSDFGLFSTHYFEQLLNGEVDQIDLYISFKKMEKFIETILPFIKERVDETKLTGEGYSKHHVTLKTQNGRSFYDYSKCNDVLIDEYKSLIKEREKFLQSITKPTEVADEETGEVVVLNPPIKKQGVSVVLRYNKDDE